MQGHIILHYILLVHCGAQASTSLNIIPFKGFFLFRDGVRFSTHTIKVEPFIKQKKTDRKKAERK